MRAASTRSPEVVEYLEKQLTQSLRPVTPSQEFVSHLHTRLTTPTPTVLERREHTAFGLLLMAFSLLSGVFLIWLLRQFRAQPV
jgi:uncharacterized iron-regulated membrane protein